MNAVARPSASIAVDSELHQLTRRLPGKEPYPVTGWNGDRHTIGVHDVRRFPFVPNRTAHQQNKCDGKAHGQRSVLMP